MHTPLTTTIVTCVHADINKNFADLKGRGGGGGGEYNNNYDDGKLGAILCACLIMTIKSDVKKTVIVYS